MGNEIIDNFLDKAKSEGGMTKSFFTAVYAYMFLGLMVSGVVSYYLHLNNEYVNFMFNETGGMSAMGYVTIFAPVAVPFLMQAKMHKFSPLALIGMFVLYSGLLGISLSFIFAAYTKESIVSVFFISAGMFGLMAVLGATTKIDLSKFGSIMYMLFIGIFIMSIVNIFIGSEPLGWLISIIGVFVFTGLTAYEMQNLKHLSKEPGYSEMDRKKLAIIGGLKLYILFVNLFMVMLRLFGSRD
jgi:FtsH-binding integral membrane protein